MAKENNLKKIYEALLNRNKINEKSQIAGLIKQYNKKFRTKINIENTIKYLSRHNYIKRIFLNFY